MLAHARRLEGEDRVLLIFVARGEKLLLPPHPFLVLFRDAEGATVKGQEKHNSAGEGSLTASRLLS